MELEKVQLLDSPNGWQRKTMVSMGFMPRLEVQRKLLMLQKLYWKQPYDLVLLIQGNLNIFDIGLQNILANSNFSALQ